jgi:hypothetical protein
MKIEVGLYGMTAEEVADYDLTDRLYEGGAVCAPEFEDVARRCCDAMKRAEEVFFGEHFAEVDRLVDEYKARLDAIRRAPRPYLCRVPGCSCTLPKTLDEWRAFCRGEGLEVAA